MSFLKRMSLGARYRGKTLAESKAQLSSSKYNDGMHIGLTIKDQNSDYTYYLELDSADSVKLKDWLNSQLV